MYGDYYGTLRDVRRQNRERLEEQILPILKSLGIWVFLKPIAASADIAAVDLEIRISCCRAIRKLEADTLYTLLTRAVAFLHAAVNEQSDRRVVKMTNDFINPDDPKLDVLPGNIKEDIFIELPLPVAAEEPPGDYIIPSTPPPGIFVQ